MCEVTDKHPGYMLPDCHLRDNHGIEALEHAEQVPLIQHQQLFALLQKMYVTMFPCNECSKLLIQAGIREIVYYEDKATPVRDTSPNEAPTSNIRWNPSMCGFS